MSRWERALLFLFMLLVVGMRIYHAPNYPYHEDEIGSIGVMRSIVETGLPLAENGTLYWRSLLGHYLMAIPLFFAQVSPVSTRLVCILFSALLLPVVYAMGNRAAGKAAGWLAVLFLGFSAFENLYASMARFYLPFQFFFVAAVYWAGEYFIARRPSSGKWLLLSTLGAIGHHHFALALLPLFFLSFLLGGHWDLLRSSNIWISSAFLVLVGYFSFVFVPNGAFINYIAIPLQVGGLEDKWAFYDWFRRLTPMGTTLLILGVVPLLWDRNRIFAFYFLGFVYSVALLSWLSPGDNPRYLSHLYPLGVVSVMVSLVWWGRQGWRVVRSKERPSKRWSRQAPLVVVVLMAVVYAVTLENVDIRTAFGRYFRFVDQQPAHEFIKRRFWPTDLIISTEPGFTALYLGRPPDYFIREKYDSSSGEYGPFSALEKGTIKVAFIDTPEGLEKVLSSTDRRIWLYTNWKITKTVSLATDDLIKRHFRPMFSEKETYVLIRP